MNGHYFLIGGTNPFLAPFFPFSLASGLAVSSLDSAVDLAVISACYEEVIS